ncbi:MAG: bifunctional hydroxymethylpyrimidine kinase/phosphomethylpyrimidine kinase, partial [Bacteroidia bacterium]
IKKINPTVKIVVDPVWRASAGMTLNESKVNNVIFKYVDLLTPNVPEFEYISNGKNKNEFIKEFVSHSNLLLKGGHSARNIGTDILYTKDKTTEFSSSEKNIYAKHGSGCVLSAAITAELALGKNMEEACASGKSYIEKFLSTNKSLLGYHAS